MTPKIRCCQVGSVFGYSLRQGVVFVAISSIVISVVTLFSALAIILTMSNKELVYNSNSMNAINMIFSLFWTSTSLYQVTISIMLLWFGLWKKGAPFVLSLWFGSHMSLLTLYCFMFMARIFVCCSAKEYLQASITGLGGVIYNGIFIYFSIIVNSYACSLDPGVLYF